MFQDKSEDKIKAHILYSVTFLRKSCLLWGKVENCCKAGQDNIMRSISIACWTTKATNTLWNHNT